MKIYTIGFTHKSAKEFFETLKKAGVKRVVDIRLKNVSQLAGFTKKDDLAYFLRELLKIDYVHELLLAPTEEIMDNFKKKHGNWQTFEKAFHKLMAERKIESKISPKQLDGGCLLCSEVDPLQCHRSLVAEYFKSHWKNVEIHHL